MADPLAELAEREVPERTNYFNPADAQTIISRYANARRGAESSEMIAKSADRFPQGRENTARLDRQKVLWDREDEEYQAKQDARARKGEFMEQLYDIKGNDPEFDTKITNFFSAVPPELVEEPEVKAALAHKYKVADDWRSSQNAEAAKRQTLENQQSMFREKAQYGKSFEHITEDDKAAHRLPDGTYDLQALYTIGNERARAYKEGEFNRRLDLVNQGRVKLIETQELSKRGRERRSTVDKYIVEDRASFPRHIDTVTEEYKKATGKTSVDPKMLADNPKWREKFAQAKAWDAKPLDSELSAAFAYDEPEDYVTMKGRLKGLTDSQKERRRMVWEHAHKDGAVEEMEGETPTSSTPAPETPVEEPPAPQEFQKTKDIGGVKYGFDGKGWKKVGG